MSALTFKFECAPDYHYLWVTLNLYLLSLKWVELMLRSDYRSALMSDAQRSGALELVDGLLSHLKISLPIGLEWHSIGVFVYVLNSWADNKVALYGIVTSLAVHLIFQIDTSCSRTIGELLNQIDYEACYLVGAICYLIHHTTMPQRKLS